MSDMNALFETVVQTLLEELGLDEVNPKVIELAIKFLHNNGVNADMGAHKDGPSLMSKLPSFDEEIA